MKVGLVGPSYQDISLPLDAQRTINLYPVIDEAQNKVVGLQGTPGLSLFSTCGVGPGRGTFSNHDDRAFTVSGSGLYEISSTGLNVLLGTLVTSSGNVSMDENGLQLAICDGTNLYIYTYATNTFAQVTDPDLLGAGTVTFIDGYFAVSIPGSGKFQISALYDGTSWNALDFATAESSPDNLARVFLAVGQLWLLGTKTVEIWTNTGNSVFPFQRISGAKMETGCVAANSVVALDNSIFWLGRDVKGSGIVYRANGFQPLRISTSAIENILRQVTNLSILRAYSYQQNGHTFYVLTGTGLNTTLVYDVSTKQWHERAYLNAQGYFEPHLGISGMFALNKQLVADRTNGNVYVMSLDYYDDAGSPMKAQRTFTHIINDEKPMRANQLQVDFEAGAGLTTGQGSDPQAWLEVSEDHGRTWSPSYSTTIGAIGSYLTRAVWRRLGFAYAFTFRVSITDPVKRSLTGAWLT